MCVNDKIIMMRKMLSAPKLAKGLVATKKVLTPLNRVYITLTLYNSGVGLLLLGLESGSRVLCPHYLCA